MLVCEKDNLLQGFVPIFFAILLNYYLISLKYDYYDYLMSNANLM